MKFHAFDKWFAFAIVRFNIKILYSQIHNFRFVPFSFTPFLLKRKAKLEEEKNAKKIEFE